MAFDVPKYEPTTLRATFSKAIIASNTMADRLDYSEILKESSYDDEEENSDDGESMKSNPWKNKTANGPPKKRRRTQSRGDTKRFLPSDITYDQFKQTLIAMAYAGLNLKFNFYDWARMVGESSSMKGLPCDRLQVNAVTDSYYYTTHRLFSMMESIIPFGKIGWPPVNLFNCLRQLAITHRLTYSNKIATQGMQCSIDNTPPKGNNGLVVFDLYQHRVVKNEEGNFNYFEPMIDKRNFVVSTRYDKIIFAFWWLINLDLLVAKNCRDWVNAVKNLDIDVQRKEFPEFSSASDIELAVIFVDEHEDECREMLAKLIEYTTLLDKKTNELQKRKPAFEKNAIAMEARERMI